MKIQAEILIDAALDWAVAVAEGGTPVVYEYQNSKGSSVYQHERAREFGVQFRPSTVWSQGGPIIERERIAVMPYRIVGTLESGADLDQIQGWQAHTARNHYWQTVKCLLGPTLLIAAMRAYVAHRLGPEIEVPDLLVRTYITKGDSDLVPMPQKQFVVLVGTVVSGISTYGPFDSRGEASAWGESCGAHWCVAEMFTPTEGE